MSAPPNCQLNRRRRIVKSDICDRHHLATCARPGDKRCQSALFFNSLPGAGCRNSMRLQLAYSHASNPMQNLLGTQQENICDLYDDVTDVGVRRTASRLRGLTAHPNP